MAALASAASASSANSSSSETCPSTEYSGVSGVVQAHNSKRALETTASPALSNLSWDATVACYSKKKAEYLANSNGCKLSHSVGPTNPGYGENLFWGSVTTYTASSVVGAWYDEKLDYTYATNTCASGKACGHYTQVVWKNTTKVGCYAAVCPSNGGIIWACNYDPPGNYVGQKPY